MPPSDYSCRLRLHFSCFLLPSFTRSLNKCLPFEKRGFTGHSLSRLGGKHMDGFGLINMNGRLYDPYLQRFLSPDNYVQSPDNAQNYNRYSYCLNNPLMYTDPSGWFALNNWSEFWSVVGDLWNSSFGGNWSSESGVSYYSSTGAAMEGAANSITGSGGWGNTNYPGGAHVETVFIGSRYAHDRSRGFSMLSSFCDAFVSSFVANSNNSSTTNSTIDAITGADKFSPEQQGVRNISQNGIDFIKLGKSINNILMMTGMDT